MLALIGIAAIVFFAIAFILHAFAHLGGGIVEDFWLLGLLALALYLTVWPLGAAGWTWVRRQ